MGKLIKQTKLFLEQNIFKYMSDEMFLKFYYLIFFGKKLDLKNPKTFNEKLQWLKLYDRNPAYCKMVDKYEVKKYVADIIGDEYIVPCYGVWDSFDEIDFSALPEQFVLKCTHGCGGIYICKDRNQFDYKSAKKEIVIDALKTRGMTKQQALETIIRLVENGDLYAPKPNILKVL